MSLQKSEWIKFCNCRNSKCMKLYCQCFAARVQCGFYCHCIDCHNKSGTEHMKIYKDYNSLERKSIKEEVVREHKGCACRKSGCTKKYCQCYQAGLLCRDLCKCIDCQNNESLSNKKVISELKRSTSTASNKGPSLYPIILTQDNRHLNQILADQNPLNLQDEWIDKTAQELYKKAASGSISGVLQKMIDVLSILQSNTLFHSQGEDFRNDPSSIMRNQMQQELKQEKRQLKFQSMDLQEVKKQSAYDDDEQQGNNNNSSQESQSSDINSNHHQDSSIPFSNQQQMKE